jgi:hypothetical protein
MLEGIVVLHAVAPAGSCTHQGYVLHWLGRTGWMLHSLFSRKMQSSVSFCFAFCMTNGQGMGTALGGHCGQCTVHLGNGCCWLSWYASHFR